MKVHCLTCNKEVEVSHIKHVVANSHGIFHLYACPHDWHCVVVRAKNKHGKRIEPEVWYSANKPVKDVA